MEIPYDIQMLNSVVAHKSAYTSSAYTGECLNRIASVASVHPAVLAAYLLTERAPAGHIRINSDGSYDVGPMQINSVHWKTFYLDFGIEPLSVRFDGCVNLMAGTKIVRDVFDRHGRDGISGWDNFYKIAAEYHSSTPKHNIRYQTIWGENFKKVLENGFEFE